MDAARKSVRGRGFTLIELLVVIAIVGILIAVLLPALGRARKFAELTAELSAARQFNVAHRMYADDFEGALMPGYASDSMVTSGDVRANDEHGQPLSGLVAKRYPWRLLPYLEYNLGILYRDRRIIESQFEGLDYTYAVSAGPRVGLNQTFIGGSADNDGTGYAFLPNAADQRSLRQAWGANWFARRVTDVARTQDLIVFASSYGANPINGVDIDGMYRITPPYFLSRRWQVEAPDETTPAGQVGNVAFRLGRVPATMFDGHGEMLGWDELQDMRRWSPTADREDFTLPVP